MRLNFDDLAGCSGLLEPSGRRLCGAAAPEHARLVVGFSRSLGFSPPLGAEDASDYDAVTEVLDGDDGWIAINALLGQGFSSIQLVLSLPLGLQNFFLLPLGLQGGCFSLPPDLQRFIIRALQ